MLSSFYQCTTVGAGFRDSTSVLWQVAGSPSSCSRVPGPLHRVLGTCFYFTVGMLLLFLRFNVHTGLGDIQREGRAIGVRSHLGWRRGRAVPRHCEVPVYLSILSALRSIMPIA
jgi:hypothetical protein